MPEKNLGWIEVIIKLKEDNERAKKPSQGKINEKGKYS